MIVKSNKEKKPYDEANCERNLQKQKTWETKAEEKKRKGDYYLDCSKDVYFRAVLLLTCYRIRQCEEPVDADEDETRRRRREVEQCCWKCGEEEEELKTSKTRGNYS